MFVIVSSIAAVIVLAFVLGFWLANALTKELVPLVDHQELGITQDQLEAAQQERDLAKDAAKRLQAQLDLTEETLDRYRKVRTDFASVEPSHFITWSATGFDHAIQQS
jgi:septal ring factor EnvC (AmiA/AmiB activator)